MRTRDALASGIHPRTLYAMRDRGLLERVSRGVYRLSDADPLSDPDLLAIAARVPTGVICLTSALAFHELTTQIPHEVDIALPGGAWTPKISYPPIRIYRFGGRSMTEGIENWVEDGITISVFSPEKTLADCFKFRNKIGLDIATEALRMYRAQRKQNLPVVMRYAEVDRVANVMRPYLEATL